MDVRESLVTEIEVNRERLVYAIAKRDTGLINRTSTLLAELHAQFYREFAVDVKATMDIEPMILVFSIEYPDGLRVSKLGYKHLVKSMSHEDRETHVATAIPLGLEQATDQAIYLERERRMRSKARQIKSKAS